MLVTCPECGERISEKAESCPQCGYIFTETTKANAIELVIENEKKIIQQRECHQKLINGVTYLNERVKNIGEERYFYSYRSCKERLNGICRNHYFEIKKVEALSTWCWDVYPPTARIWIHTRCGRCGTFHTEYLYLSKAEDFFKKLIKKPSNIDILDLFWWLSLFFES